ncbi:MAG TPA: OmpA family protein [Bryobacteraceae bacterium]|nr:OmpA family protein [Bryobacteraceae bacterium]
MQSAHAAGCGTKQKRSFSGLGPIRRVRCSRFRNGRRQSLTLSSALLLMVAVGCHKKAVPPPPPPPPTAATPPASKPSVDYFAAEPSTVNSGQPSSLRWSVTGATSVAIDNSIGTVSPNGRRAVYPTATTTYHLAATGPGGETDADTTITVSAPPPPAPVQNNSAATIQDILAHQVQDLHFDYDKSEVRPADQSILQADAAALKQIFTLDSNFIVTVEGHCDERGSAEYNLALGDRRASATRDALVALGVPSDKLKTISYGKERPLCTDAAEECYARNRRAHFAATQ